MENHSKRFYVEPELSVSSVSMETGFAASDGDKFEAKLEMWEREDI